jgi:hypothetical protein
MDSATEQEKTKGSDQNHSHTVEIIVNGQKKVVAKDELSFDELVALAFENPPTGDNWLITISYRRGPGKKPEGTLVKGETVKVKDGMIFNVDATDRS